MRGEFIFLILIASFSVLKWLAEKLGQAGKHRLATERQARRRVQRTAGDVDEADGQHWEEVWSAPDQSPAESVSTAAGSTPSRLEGARAEVREFLQGLVPVASPANPTAGIQPVGIPAAGVQRTTARPPAPPPKEPSTLVPAPFKTRIAPSTVSDAYEIPTRTNDQRHRRGPLRLRRKDLQRAIILREIIGPPVALRSEDAGSSGSR